MPRLCVNGVHLNIEVQQGPSGAPVLVLLHGFTGSAMTWASHMAALSDVCTAVAIDALGHGHSDSPTNPVRYGMARVVDDTLAVLDQLGIERCVLLGYSMGGRMALQIAAAAEQRVAALILESASPGLKTADERLARIAADEQLAALLERDGMAAFVDRWERMPIFGSQQQLPAVVRQAQREQRLQGNPQGLAASLRGAGTGVQPPLHDRLGTLTMPTLLIVGALDTKFCAIAHELHAALPDAELAIVPGVGHAVHLEAPDQFDTLIRSFIRRITWHP